jgi:hypothetical protein
MAARSTAVTFANNTHNTLLLKVGENLAHGEWSTEPPNEIGPGSQVGWGSESSGFLTGTEGWVRYYPVDANTDNVGIPSPVPDSATIYIYWDNPFAGSNSYQTAAPPPYQVTQQGDGSGDNASIGFALGGAYGPDTCFPGYVWRGASPKDHVCVSPATRDQVAYDNSQAASRINPNGPFGPDTCVEGYVWREAFPGDHVCVTPETRSQAASDNSQAANRLL